MGIRRMDHVGIVVDDIDRATAFFEALGLRRQGEGTVEGDWVGRVIGLEGGVRSRLVMLETPGGDGRIELAQFETPPSPPGDPEAPANVPGLRHVTFRVDDVDAALVALQPHGGVLVGTVERYGDVFRLCYVRGPAGIIVELAEELGGEGEEPRG